MDLLDECNELPEGHRLEICNLLKTVYFTTQSSMDREMDWAAPLAEDSVIEVHDAETMRTVRVHVCNFDRETRLLIHTPRLYLPKNDILHHQLCLEIVEEAEKCGLVDATVLAMRWYGGYAAQNPHDQTDERVDPILDMEGKHTLRGLSKRVLQLYCIVAITFGIRDDGHVGVETLMERTHTWIVNVLLNPEFAMGTEIDGLIDWFRHERPGVDIWGDSVEMYSERHRLPGVPYIMPYTNFVCSSLQSNRLAMLRWKEKADYILDHRFGRSGFELQFQLDNPHTSAHLRRVSYGSIVPRMIIEIVGHPRHGLH